MAVFSALVLFMTGGLFGLPFAPLTVLPFVPLIKPITASRVLSKGFAVILIPCAGVTAYASLPRFARFVKLAALPKTPLWLIAALSAAVAVFLASGGADGIKKWAALTLPLAAAFIALSALLLAGKLKFESVAFPRFWEGNPVVTACGAVTVLGVMPALNHKIKPFRTYLAAFAAASALGAAVWALSVFTLGAEAAGQAEEPFFNALRAAKGGELIGRVEPFLLPAALAPAVLKTGLCLYIVVYACKALKLKIDIRSEKGDNIFNVSGVKHERNHLQHPGQ